MLRGGVFDDGTFIEKGCIVGHAGGLLHIVSYYDNGVVSFQFEDQVFDFGRGYRIEGACRLVHQNNFRVCRQGARDAKPLLLAAGKAKRRFLHAVLDLVPQRGAFQREFHNLGEFALVLDAVYSGAVGDVIEDAFGERV